jgi:hypothetical protein
MLWLMLQSGLYYKQLFKTQNPRLVNKTGFKSRAVYNGVSMVYENGYYLPFQLLL